MSCKRPAFLRTFSRLQMIQNKRPWCRGAAYVEAGLSYGACFENVNELENKLGKRVDETLHSETTEPLLSIDLFKHLITLRYMQ